MEIPFNIVVCHRQILSFERRACKKFKESAAKNVVSDFEINCSWSMGSWRLVLSHFSLHNAQIKKKNVENISYQIRLSGWPPPNPQTLSDFTKFGPMRGIIACNAT